MGLEWNDFAETHDQPEQEDISQDLEKEICPECNGTGYSRKSPNDACYFCKGTGYTSFGKTQMVSVPNRIRLIDANVLLKKIEKNPHRRSLERVIAAIPSIEAKPVVHGQWIKQKTDNGAAKMQCSECDNQIDVDKHKDGTESFDMVKNAYCGQCGAKMDKV